MRRSIPFALILILAAAACGPAEVVVTMEIDVPNPDADGTMQLILSDIEVQLIPFDRDVVFDSMTTAYGTPEPEIPQDLIEQRAEVQAAQAVLLARASLLDDELPSRDEVRERVLALTELKGLS